MTSDLREWNPVYYLEASLGKGGVLETQNHVCLDVCWSMWATRKQGHAVGCSPVPAVASTVLISVSIHDRENGFAPV